MFTLTILLGAINIAEGVDTLRETYWMMHKYAPAGSHILFTYIDNTTHEYKVIKAINVFESDTYFCLIGGIELTKVISKSDITNLRIITIKNLD